MSRILSPIYRLSRTILAEGFWDFNLQCHPNHTLKQGHISLARSLKTCASERSTAKVVAAKAAVDLNVDVDKEEAAKSVGRVIPDFKDVRVAYKAKSTKELLRAYFVFTLCSYNILLDNQIKILAILRKVLGAKLFRAFLKATFYGQFQGGETDEEIHECCRKLAKNGVIPLLSFTAAELHGNFSGVRSLEQERELWMENFALLTHGIQLAVEAREYLWTRPQIAVKFSYLCNCETFRQITNMINWNIAAVKDVLSSNDAKRIDILKNILLTHAGTRDLDTVDRHLTKNSFNLALYNDERMIELSPQERKPIISKEIFETYNWLIKKLDEVGQYVYDNEVTLIVDAEQTYIQPAIECLTLDLMRKFNKDRYSIQHTYQTYLKRTYDIVKRDMEIACTERFMFGGKVVRGAYMDEERRLAKENGIEDPVNPSYDKTTEYYNRVIKFLLDQYQNQREVKMQLTFASHCEETMIYVLNEMDERKLDTSSEDIILAQIVGMRDHLAFTLGYHGLPGAKLVQYGDVEDGVAYLSRRLLENRSGLPTAEVERTLLKQEVKRRLLKK